MVAGIDSFIDKFRGLEDCYGSVLGLQRHCLLW